MSTNKNGKSKSENANKNVSTLIKDFDEKLLYWVELVHSKYEDESFYLLRHEFHKLHIAFLAQENVMFSTSKIFTHKGKKYTCEEYNLLLTFRAFEQTNKQVVFHNFNRNKLTGEIVITAKSLT